MPRPHYATTGVNFTYKILTKNISTIPWLNRDRSCERGRTFGNTDDDVDEVTRWILKENERWPSYGKGLAGGRGRNGKATWCWRRDLNRTQGRPTIGWAHWPADSAFLYPKSQTNSLYFVCGFFFLFWRKITWRRGGKTHGNVYSHLGKGRYSICNGYT